MFDVQNAYLSKAQESLDGAFSEYANNRPNNCANRCYYACFQAAIHALVRAGVRPRGTQSQWSHEFVQAEFGGQMIRRRRLYPSELRDTLSRAFSLRQVADYGRDTVSDAQAVRILDRAERFLETIDARGER